MPRDKAKSQEEKLEIQLVPDASLQSERIYSNFAQVSHTPHDFTIRFCDATPITEAEMSEAKKTGKHRVPIVAEIAIPIAMVQSLIAALTTQLQKFHTNYGEAGNVEQAQNKANAVSTIQ
jgi:hypothetical protein